MFVSTLFFLFTFLHNSFSNFILHGEFEFSENDSKTFELKTFNDEWEAFLSNNNRKYDQKENEMRYEIFKNNLMIINTHNKLYEAGKVSYKMGINQFTDMTNEEARIRYTGLDMSVSKNDVWQYFKPNSNVDVPSSLDWRKKHVVTSVKNQGNCGSCYAFSATGSMESQYAINNNQMISLSEQNIIDCSWDYGNKGCSGGLMGNVFEYVKNNHGIDTEEMYPYQGMDESCRYKRNPFTLTGQGMVDSENETALMMAVATIGPISVAINANSDFMSYESGIFTSDDCSPLYLNHGVLVVGYGVERGMDYWIVKNSWGVNWGMSGYIRMARNRNNLCGIASYPVYPIL